MLNMNTMSFNARGDAYLRARAREQMNKTPDTSAQGELGEARRVNVSAWGSGEFDVPTDVLVEPGEWPPYAMGDAIASKNGLSRLTLRHEHYNLQTQRDVWVMSMGRPASGGGFNVVNEVWFCRA